MHYKHYKYTTIHDNTNTIQYNTLQYNTIQYTVLPRFRLSVFPSSSRKLSCVSVIPSSSRKLSVGFVARVSEINTERRKDGNALRVPEMNTERRKDGNTSPRRQFPLPDVCWSVSFCSSTEFNENHQFCI